MVDASDKKHGGDDFEPDEQFFADERYHASDDTNDGDDERLESDVIRAEMGRTRRAIDRTIDALQERLDPKVIVERVFNSVRTHADKPMQYAGRFVRENPLPLAVIGLGVAWLIAQQVRAGKERGHPHTGAPEAPGRGGSTPIGGSSPSLRDKGHTTFARPGARGGAPSTMPASAPAGASSSSPSSCSRAGFGEFSD